MSSNLILLASIAYSSFLYFSHVWFKIFDPFRYPSLPKSVHSSKGSVDINIKFPFSTPKIAQYPWVLPVPSYSATPEL